jgi:hypothetical protein
MKKGFISHFRTGIALSFLPYLIMGHESHTMILTIFLFGPNLKIFANVYILFFNYPFFQSQPPCKAEEDRLDEGGTS